MKTFILCLAIAAAGYHFWSSHGEHPRSYYASKAMQEPSPVLSDREVSDDMPDGSQFEKATWVAASKEDALVFSEGCGDDHCSNAWRNSVSNAGSGSYFEKTSLPGRRGICTWHMMRKKREGGLLESAFTRPGPRRVTQAAG
jgi:hypothetical protein